MQLPDAQACLANAVDLAMWCETQATALDPMIRSTRRGQPLSPRETVAMLEGMQELHRRTGQQQILLATMLMRWQQPAPVSWWRRLLP